jgi:predicted dehydrogenase
VLGQGSIGRRHATLLRELRCEVVVFDPFAATVAEGVERADGIEEALAGADAVVVASPTSEHPGQVATVLAAGLPVLVEKPLATTAQEAARVVDLARQESTLLAVAMNLRFHPGPRTVHEVIAGGAIGRPLLAHFTFGSYLPNWRPGTDYRVGYSARRELGGGVLLDVIHEVDYASWILGPARAVSARVARVSDLEIDVEDAASLGLEFAGGAVASMDLDYLDRSYRRGCRVVGDTGTVDWDWARETVVVYGPDGDAEERPAPSDVAPTYREQLAAFLAAIRAGNADVGDSGLVAGREALAALQVVDAARESSDTGRRVEVVPL